MKNIPLSVQIWALCAGVTLCVFGLIMFFLPGMLNGFFTSQVYTLLEESQRQVQFIQFESNLPDQGNGVVSVTLAQTATNSPQSPPNLSGQPDGQIDLPPKSGDEQKQPSDDAGKVSGVISIAAAGDGSVETKEGYFTIAQPATFIAFSSVGLGNDPSGLPPVSHILLPDDPNSELPSALPAAFTRIMREQSRGQTEETKRYSHTEGNSTLLYVIRNEVLEGKPSHLVSYAWGSYTQELSANLTKRLFWLMVALCLLTLLPSLLLARYLVKPLNQIEEAASRISERDWDQPLVLNRRDEIGRLARAFEQMRQRLARQDEAQQAFLQNLSHELKTPAMVISSYAKAILDGIFPRGNLQDSVEVIHGESERLQNRVQNFLYLNKLKYMALREPEKEGIRLDLLIEDVVERLRWRRPEIEWDLKLDETAIEGSRQQWSVAMENLLDNQMRYAKCRVEISLNIVGESSDGLKLRVFNDGAAIDEEMLEQIFDPYSCGKDGQFGLGLAITRQVMDMHGARIRACNEDQGVAFYIEKSFPRASAARTS